MGWTIGMPSLKLSNTTAKSKHCGNFQSVISEALEERQGRDSDIDKSRADNNIYYGYKTAAELQEYSEKHIAELSAKQVAAGGRKIRDDAVVMCATIIKPPAAFVNSLSEEKQLTLCHDCIEKLAQIVGADNIKSIAIHRDEKGIHLHAFWEPMTADGRLCAKEKHNLKFLGQLNREMPEFLRSRGWDIADCKAYDQAQEILKTEQQRAEEHAKNGRSSAVYKAEAEREKNLLIKQINALQSQIEACRGIVDKFIDIDALKPQKTLTGGIKGVTVDDIEQLKQAAKKLAIIERDFDSLKAEYSNQSKFILSFEEQNQIIQDRDKLHKLESIIEKLPDSLKKQFEQQICKEEQFFKEER